MIVLEFADELYDGFALDEAIKTFEPYAGLERSRGEGRYVVRVTAHDDHDEVEIAGELSNYALGRTVERRTRGEAGEGDSAAAGGGDAR